jgi:hypothetical protein
VTLQLTAAVRSGLDRATTRTGAILFGLFLALQAITVTSFNTLFASVAPPEASAQFGLTLPIPGAAAGILLLGGYLAMGVYFVVVSRAFVRPPEHLSTFSSDLYTRRIGRASLTMIVAGVIVFVSIMIGFVLLLVPGIFLSICFLFFLFAIGVEDRGVVGSLRRSWDLSRGNRLKLGVVFVLMAAIGGAVGTIGALFELIGVPAVGDVLTILVNGVLIVFLYALLAAIYLQLTDENADGSTPKAA